MLKLSMAAAVLLGAFTANAVAEVKVAASIPPVYTLAKAVMHGVGEPTLLISAGTSPHTYAMKPSDVKKIAESDVIFMISPEFETFMAKASQNKKTAVYLADTNGIKLLPTRDDHLHPHELNDLHIWLSYQNAVNITQKIADVLSQTDKENSHIYAKNAAQEIAKINALAIKTTQTLQQVKSKPFFVYHDAGQYFENQNGLHGAIVVLPHEGISLGVKQRAKLQQIADEQKIKCLMVEPWENDEKTAKLATDLGVKAVEFNPLGDTGNGNLLYVDIMEQVLSAYKKCLEQ